MDNQELNVKAGANRIQEFSTDLLRLYYSRLFPYDSMFRWLTYGNDPDLAQDDNVNDKDFFSKREWSFTIENDIYIRYQSFKDKSEMIQAIQRRQPHKIDIGAVFTSSPKDRNTLQSDQFQTVEREVVFDIDMTDYDSIRVCCKGADICQRCWPYMTMAIKVVDRSLREDFAFNNIFWVYSGRRGVHCWVCDPSARNLPNEARAAIVDYLSVQTSQSQENTDKKLKSTFVNPHPLIRKSYDILEPMFEKYIANEKGQGLLMQKEKYIKILNSLPNESVRKELYELWDKDDANVATGQSPRITGAERWRQVKMLTTDTITSAANSNAVRKKRINYVELESWRYELVFEHCYPRLDANVTKTQNHLLKSPFCIHPKTGRVCVPINPLTAEQFDPFSVPTVRTLCDEIDEYDRNNLEANTEGKKIVSDANKTSLMKAITDFDNNFLKGLYMNIRKQRRQEMEKQSAAYGDF